MSRLANRPQRGFSLIVVVLMLVVIMVLGIGAAQTSLVSERSARNDRDTEVAFQAAEAALLDAENDVFGPNASAQQRLCLFNSKDVTAFVSGCGEAGDRQGLCAAAEPGAQPAWMTADFSAAAGKSVAYGTFTGQAYLGGASGGALSVRPPRYIVEAIRSRGGWQASQLQGAGARDTSFIFRVTAIGFGMRDDTQVVLQTNLYKPTASPGCPS